MYKYVGYPFVSYIYIKLNLRFSPSFLNVLQVPHET